MLSEKLVRPSNRWLLLALTVGLALTVALSMALAGDAEAKKKKKKKKRSQPPPALVVSPSPTEQLLTSRGGLWFEYDFDSDGVCYLYDFKNGNFAPHLRVVRHAYPVNFFTGQCRLSTPLSPSYGGVGSASSNLLTIQWPSGYVERIDLGTYNSGSDSLPISRSTTGTSGWYGCASGYNPYSSC